MSVFHDFYIQSPDAIFDEFEISVMRINNKYVFESALGIDDNDLFSEAETPSNVPKKSWLSSMAERIGRLIKDFCNMIKNMFSFKGHLTLDDYKNSDTGKAQIDYDLRVVQDGVDAEVRKGRKLIQAISKGTHIDDAEVERFVDGTANILKKFAIPTIVTIGSIASFKAWEAKANKTNDEMQNAAKEGENATPENKSKIQKIYSSMAKLVNEGLKARTICIKQIQNASNKNKKNK